MKVKNMAIALQVILWISTMIFAVIWLLNVEIPCEPEPLTVVLLLISGAVSGLVKEYTQTIDFEQYSVADVLAKGYVNNFFEPVLTQLMKDSNGNANKPLFYIFIPELLS